MATVSRAAAWCVGAHRPQSPSESPYIGRLGEKTTGKNTAVPTTPVAGMASRAQRARSAPCFVTAISSLRPHSCAQQHEAHAPGGDDVLAVVTRQRKRRKNHNHHKETGDKGRETVPACPQARPQSGDAGKDQSRRQPQRGG